MSATVSGPTRSSEPRRLAIAGLIVGVAVSFGIGDSWVVDNVELPITRDLCGGSCTGIESDNSSTGPVAVLIVAAGLLLTWFALRGTSTARDRRTIVAAAGTVLCAITLAALAVLLVRQGVFGQRFPSLDDRTCFQDPQSSSGGCLREPPASAVWPILGIIAASLAAALTSRPGRRPPE